MEDSSNISIKYKKNKDTCFSYVVPTRNHRDVSKSISTRKHKYVYSFCAYAYAMVIPSEDNIRKTNVCSSYASCLCLCLCTSENQPLKMQCSTLSTLTVVSQTGCQRRHMHLYDLNCRLDQ